MDTKNGTSGKSRMVDVFTVMLESLCIYSHSLGKKTSQIARNFAEQFQITDLVDEIGEKFAEHPILRFLAVATALGCAIPVALFVAFGLVSVILTFTGFLLVEGIVLIIGGLCMITCLMTMVMIMSVLAIVLAVSYFIVTKFTIWFKNYKPSPRFLRHLRPTVMNNGGLGISNSVDDVHQD